MRRTLPLLALLGAFPPLATDMYLPAIPLLQAQWQVPLATINLTLVLFFLSFSVSLLIYGPLSDRYGRRPVLLGGITLYVAASLLCSLARSIEALIGFRILQAAGAGAASALALAICRDLFEDRDRERALAYLGVIIALAPMLSPTIGGWILMGLSWPWIFITQSLLGLVALVGVFFMAEPLRTKLSGSPWKVYGLYGRVARNRSFMSYNLLMSISLCPLFAFVGGSSDIYINGFGVSEQVFGYFFGLNALALMGGSFTCLRLVQIFPGRRVLVWGFAGVLAGGVCMLVTGPMGPWGFAAPMCVVSFCMGMNRPLSNNLVLKQVDRDVGTASSLMIFTYFVCGALAIWTVSLDWEVKPRFLAILTVSSATCVLLLLHLLEQRNRDKVQEAKSM